MKKYILTSLISATILTPSVMTCFAAASEAVVTPEVKIESKGESRGESKGESKVESKAPATSGYQTIKLDNHILYRYDFDVWKNKLLLGKAFDNGKFLVEDVYSFAKRNNAKAAFNGGFFLSGHSRNGIPASLMINDQNVFIVSARKPVVYQDHTNQIKILHIDANPFIETDIKKGLTRENKKIDVASVNVPSSGGVKAYTSHYWHTTLTPRGTYEIVVKDGVVADINEQGNNKIPESNSVVNACENFVISCDASMKKSFMGLAIGSKLNLNYGLSDDNTKLDVAKINWMVSGSDILIEDRQLSKAVTSSKNKSSFRDDGHARTAICQFDHYQFSAIVADNNKVSDLYDVSLRDIAVLAKKKGLTREDILNMKTKDLLETVKSDPKKDSSEGISLTDLAKYLQDINCKNAINLDGGGSSTLVVNGEIVNHPVGSENIHINGKNPREVGDIFYIK